MRICNDDQYEHRHLRELHALIRNDHDHGSSHWRYEEIKALWRYRFRLHLRTTKVRMFRCGRVLGGRRSRLLCLCRARLFVFFALLAPLPFWTSSRRVVRREDQERQESQSTTSSASAQVGVGDFDVDAGALTTLVRPAEQAARLDVHHGEHPPDNDDARERDAAAPRFTHAPPSEQLEDHSDSPQQGGAPAALENSTAPKTSGDHDHVHEEVNKNKKAAENEREGASAVFHCCPTPAEEKKNKLLINDSGLPQNRLIQEPHQGGAV
ncbi:unnamed protein product, partial [Amoebophrya sp. A120]|eukprot:GSA120T00001415001.1